MDILAEARGVTRRFGDFTAVCAADLAVGPGEVVGLLGANGAGKTTLIRLLLGLLRPSSGTIRLFGSPPSIETRRRVGYVPQTLGLYAGLTVAENWAFTAAAFRITAPVPDSIAGWRHEVVGGLPLGAQRQVAFAVALSHRPELLILDEPTSGVGPLGRVRLWEDIRRAAGQGAGVLVDHPQHGRGRAVRPPGGDGRREGRRPGHGQRHHRRPHRGRGALRAMPTAPSPCWTRRGSPCSCTGRCCASPRQRPPSPGCCLARTSRRASGSSRPISTRRSRTSWPGRPPA